MTQIKLSHMSASSRLQKEKKIISTKQMSNDLTIDVNGNNIKKGTKRGRDENGGDDENENDITQDSSTSEGSINRKKVLKKR